MMLPGGDSLTREDFEELIDLARSGVLQSDTGTTDRMDSALYAVAVAAPNPPQELIDAARRAFDEG